VTGVVKADKNPFALDSVADVARVKKISNSFFKKLFRKPEFWSNVVTIMMQVSAKLCFFPMRNKLFLLFETICRSWMLNFLILLCGIHSSMILIDDCSRTNRHMRPTIEKE